MINIPKGKKNPSSFVIIFIIAGPAPLETIIERWTLVVHRG
jgi:hypothetical protein